MSYWKSFILIFILSLGCFASDGIINIDEIAKKEAKVEKKQIMVFFHMTRCPYCIKMINNAFSDKIAKQKMEKDYIFIDVNVDDEGLIQYRDFKGSKSDFAKSLAIGFYPTIVFIDEHNEIVYAMKGYRKTVTFNQILDYVTKKLYQETDFAGYLFDLEAP
jgi:thioredoxin-related protein